MVGAEREPDREIVDAQRDPGDQQPAEPLLIRGRARCPGRVGPQRLDDRVPARGDQQASAHPAGRLPEGGGQAVPERQAQDRHAGLEDPEHDADAHPGPGVHPGDADADRGGEVRQAQREGNQYEREHRPTVPIAASLAIQYERAASCIVNMPVTRAAITAATFPCTWWLSGRRPSTRCGRTWLPVLADDCRKRRGNTNIPGPWTVPGKGDQRPVVPVNPGVLWLRRPRVQGAFPRISGTSVRARRPRPWRAGRRKRQAAQPRRRLRRRRAGRRLCPRAISAQWRGSR